jgi:adenylosuccinate lyase
MAAADAVKDRGERNDLVERIAADRSFGMSAAEVQQVLDPARHTGRAAQQVDAFLREHVQPVLKRYQVEEATPELKA